MRKLQTLLAISVCVPSIANSQTGHAYEQLLHKEMSVLLKDNPITLFIDWLASPTVQSIMLFLTIMSLLFCITTLVLELLMIREFLPANWIIFFKNWKSIDQSIAVVHKKHPTPFELEQHRLQNTNANIDLDQPLLATINFLDKTKEETQALRQQLMGRKIAIVLSKDGNLVSIE